MSLSSSPLCSFVDMPCFLKKPDRYEAILFCGTVYHPKKNGFNFRSMKGAD